MKQTKNKKAIAILSVLLALVLMAVTWLTVAAVKNSNPICLFGHEYDEAGKCIRCGKDKPVDEKPEQANGNTVVQTVMAQGMSLYSVPAALAENPDTYTLTATITPVSADDKRVEWTVAWKDPSSVWAIGKTVTEYVTVTPTSANALTATLSCIKDFGEQIIVTVKSLDNTDATAQCTVDYVQRIIGFTFTMPSISSTSNTFTYDVETSAYTLKSNISFNISDSLALTENFKQGFARRFNMFSQYICYGPARLIRESENVLRLEQCNTWQLVGPADDYFYFDNIPGLFYCVDTQYLDQYLNGDMGYLTRMFIEVINEVTTAHATFDITYSSTYNGTVYSSGTKTVELKFDGNALHIPVSNVALSQGSIVF